MKHSLSLLGQMVFKDILTLLHTCFHIRMAEWAAIDIPHNRKGRKELICYGWGVVSICLHMTGGCNNSYNDKEG